MRVLYLTDSLSDLDGVGRYAVRLIAALEALGAEAGGPFEPRIQLARKHRPTSSQVPAHWPVEVALPPDYFFHMSRARFWPSLAAAAARVARAARRCDLVHAIKDYPHSLAGLLGARLARVPCVATAHGTYSVQPLLDPRHARLARWTYRNLAAVVPVSGYTRRRLFELLDEADLPRERVTTIPNAVATAPYARPPDLEVLGGEGGTRPWHAAPFTLGIGELKERKGHHLALAAWVRAARARPELHHWIVGKPSDAAYRERLLSIAREGGCAERVHLLGNVTEAEKIDLLQRAEVFVHTPVTAPGGGFEGFGIVYLEAAASGTPSLGTLESGAEDAVVDDVSGLLVAPEVGAVAAALERLLTDPLLRTRLAHSGREHAHRQSWDHNARAMLAVYRRALS